MAQQTKIHKKKYDRFTIRIDSKTGQMLKELQDMTTLSKAAIFRLALVNFYNQQMIQKSEP